MRIKGPREADLNACSELAPVQIDVGGCSYTSCLETLTKHGESRLGKLFNGSLSIVRDNKSQSYFIDRDGNSFRFVLNYLRTGKLILPDHFDEYEALLEEARWYEIDSLVRLIEDAQSKRSKTDKDIKQFDVPQQQHHQGILSDVQLKALLLRTAFRNSSLAALSSASSCSQEESSDQDAQSPNQHEAPNQAQSIDLDQN